MSATRQDVFEVKGSFVGGGVVNLAFQVPVGPGQRRRQRSVVTEEVEYF
jgi:hypothetical protein